jgi:flagellar basal-body rod protein FlgF
MIKGLYTSASGMVPRVRKQEMHANNVSNASTTGFKRDRLFTKELSKAVERQIPQRNDWETPMVDESWIDHAPGVFDKTGNQLDLAIEGDGFFTLQSPEGDTVLTRSGAFEVDAEGYLSFAGGFRVTGDGGPIQVGQGEISVAADGEVQADGLTVGRLRPQSVADVQKLNRIGSSLFVVPNGEELLPSLNATIRQGYLETSNVDVVREMVDMIISYRMYEANAKAVQTQDRTLDHLFGNVAEGK